MLDGNQVKTVWTAKYEAEIRSLYFADLAIRYTRRKQWIAGATLVLSSGAAAWIIAELPKLVGFAMALVIAILSAYSIVANLDRAATQMAKLHAGWNHLADEYDHLWSHLYDDAAERTLLELISRGRGLSSESVAEAPPYNEGVLKKWQDHVYNAYSESGGRATTEASANT